MRQVDRVHAEHDPLTSAVIGAAIEVHRVLGPGLFETVYEECLAWELDYRSIDVRRQVVVPVVYKGIRLDASYRIDLLVAGTLVVEVKAIERMLAIHDAQMLTYLKMSGACVGLLLNFNSPVLKDGIKRFSAPKRRGEEDGMSGGKATDGTDSGTAPPRHRDAEDIL
jgi:GxxExxY protein